MTTKLMKIKKSHVFDMVERSDMLMTTKLMKTTKSHVFDLVERRKSEKYREGEDVYRCRFCGVEVVMRKGCVPSNSMKGCKREVGK